MSPPTASSGTGGEVMGGVKFDDVTYTLEFSLGYGSLVGFSDLTGPVTGATLRGPAGVGTNAAILADLTAMNFPATDPAKGGVLIGKVVFPLQSTNQVADLLAGLCYVTLDTAANPYGEIRGQLIAQGASNPPPSLGFDVSPAGTDVAPGLSPSNMVPPAASSGAGGEILSGVEFQESTLTLSLNLGYGSVAGFGNLTGPVTGATLRGPAGVGTNAAIIADLTAMNFPATDPAKGGVLIGKVVFPLQSTNQVADLLAGLYYITLDTAANPSGELRGQLVQPAPSNQPPIVACPASATVEAGSPAKLTAVVSDPEGDGLTVVWSVNGVIAATNMVPSGPPASSSFAITTLDLPLGTNTIGVAATDTAGNTSSCETTIIVQDTIPPVITKVCATPSTIWPPNHKMIYVHLRATVTDAGGPTTWKITSISSNEESNGRGDGNTSSDYKIVGNHAAKVRAERSGKGDGRIYTITIQAQDASGNLSEPATVEVTVPKSKGHKPANGPQQNPGKGEKPTPPTPPSVGKPTPPTPPTPPAPPAGNPPAGKGKSGKK